MGTPITERTIDVYACINDPQRKNIAMIRGLSWVFRGESPMAARRAADDWRREALANDKLVPKAVKAQLLGGEAK